MRRFFVLILILITAGCNLETSDGTTLPPTPTFGPLPTTSYVAPTPYRVPTLINAPTAIGGGVTDAQSAGVTNAQGANAQVVGAATAIPRGNVLTPVPAEVLIENPQPSPTSQNAIEAFINNLIVPAWNFVYTFVSQGLGTMWAFAGARGGIFAQVFCCIAPIIVAGVIVAFRLRILRLWRR
jgi:hypothetical protein